MNLHNIANGAIQAVNPNVQASWQKSTGSTTGAGYGRTPTYATAQAVTVQKQPLTSNDLKQLDGLNLNGQKCAMYVSSELTAVSRPDVKGGDLITITKTGEGWLVVQELEDFTDTAGWKKIACVRQL